MRPIASACLPQRLVGSSPEDSNSRSWLHASIPGPGGQPSGPVEVL